MNNNLKRGEIWPLPGCGTADEILAAASDLQMDFCFFDQLPGAPAKAHSLGLLAGAVVDGPWQSWMTEIGWESALLELGHGTDAAKEGLAKAKTKAEQDIAGWIAAGVDMILLADDVAYSGGPYMSPAQLEAFLLPLYCSLSAGVRSAGKTVGFHADGRVDLILPLLNQAKFQFYSLEPEATDPMRAWNALGEKISLFSGLPAAWLAPDGFLPEREGEVLRQWLSSGPLTVSSACGLYHGDARKSLRKIYDWLDQENLFP